MAHLDESFLFLFVCWVCSVLFAYFIVFSSVASDAKRSRASLHVFVWLFGYIPSHV